MIGLMETACAQLIQPLLPEGSSSVGILVNVRHLAASPIGQTIRAEAEIVGIEGRKVTFKVVAYDSIEKVGEGIHERAVIDMAKFMSRVSQKAGK
jgi:predicted thioesterase